MEKFWISCFSFMSLIVIKMTAQLEGYKVLSNSYLPRGGLCYIVWGFATKCTFVCMCNVYNFFVCNSYLKRLC